MIFCISVSPEIREPAEHSALVAFAMCEALSFYKASTLPGGYRYHLYGGFPGFADHAAMAASCLLAALKPCEVDCDVEIADAYAIAIIDADVRLRRPAPVDTMRAISEGVIRGAHLTTIPDLQKRAEG